MHSIFSVTREEAENRQKEAELRHNCKVLEDIRDNLEKAKKAKIDTIERANQVESS